MKLFISADIEGCAGLVLPSETHKQESIYRPFAEEMTKEVLAACEAAHEMGADEIVVKDGHGDATNIDPFQMPEYVTLIRGKSGHPYNMMWGIDDSFDGVIFIGYHAPAGDPRFPVSHTSTGNSLYIRLNGNYMSEFMLNAYTAASHGVPVLFLSGDEAICSLAGELVPGIETAASKWGEGAAVVCRPKSAVIREIRCGIKKALRKDFSACRINMPERFVYEVTFKDWKRAYQMSFYPGMRPVDTFTDRLETENWMDVVTAHSFVVY